VPFVTISDSLDSAFDKIDSARDAVDTAAENCDKATATVKNKQKVCDDIAAEEAVQAQALLQNRSSRVLLQRKRVAADPLENELVLTMEDATEKEQVESQAAARWGSGRRRRRFLSKVVKDAGKAVKSAAKAVSKVATAVGDAVLSAAQATCNAALSTVVATMETACDASMAIVEGTLAAAEGTLGVLQTAFDAAARQVESATDKVAEVIEFMDMELVSMGFGASLETGEVSLSIGLRLGGVLDTYTFEVNVYEVLKDVGVAVAKLLAQIFEPFKEAMMGPLNDIKDAMDKLVLAVAEENVETAYALIQAAVHPTNGTAASARPMPPFIHRALPRFRSGASHGGGEARI